MSAAGNVPGRRRYARAGARGAIGLALVLLGVGIGACATTQPTVSYEQIDQRKQEIAMLWSQIRGWRQDAGLRGVEPPQRAIIEMRDKTLAQATRVCPQRVRAQTQSCTDVCSLADAICENAGRICRIADELGGDAWADGKCSSAKASCKQARQGCCRCWSEEPPASNSEAEPDAAPDTTPETEPALESEIEPGAQPETSIGGPDAAAAAKAVENGSLFSPRAP